jgi:hypothetical protein
VVHARKAQILEWKMPKFFNRFIDAGFATLNVT